MRENNNSLNAFDERRFNLPILNLRRGSPPPMDQQSRIAIRNSYEKEINDKIQNNYMKNLTMIENQQRIIEEKRKSKDKALTQMVEYHDSLYDKITHMRTFQYEGPQLVMTICIR